MTTLEIIVLVAVALLASIIASVTGTGGGVVLLPVMTVIFGVRDAVPMYAIAQLIGNLSRIWFNRSVLKIRVVAWFALGAVPAAIVGAVLFARADESVLTRLLGGFLLVTVAARRLRSGKEKGFSVRWFVPIGAVFAFISALVGSAGPFLAPFYLSYGLLRGAYIGTEALGTAIMHVTKLATYHATGVLTTSAVVVGIALGPVMVLGSYAGKRIVDRMSPKIFLLFVETMIVVFGLVFLLHG